VEEAIYDKRVILFQKGGLIGVKAFRWAPSFEETFIQLFSKGEKSIGDCFANQININFMLLLVVLLLVGQEHILHSYYQIT